MDVSRVVLLVASDFDLLEPPLRQDRVRSPQVAAQHFVAETHAGRQRMDVLHFLLLALLQIIDHLNNPVILVVTDGLVSVTGNFVVELGDRCRDGVGVQVAGCRYMSEKNSIALLDKSEGTFGIVRRLLPGGQNSPLVVIVFVVVASDLLLTGTSREGLYVRMQKTASVSNVLESDL